MSETEDPKYLSSEDVERALDKVIEDHPEGKFVIDKTGTTYFEYIKKNGEIVSAMLGWPINRDSEAFNKKGAEKSKFPENPEIAEEIFKDLLYSELIRISSEKAEEYKEATKSYSQDEIEYTEAEAKARQFLLASYEDGFTSNSPYKLDRIARDLSSISDPEIREERVRVLTQGSEE